VEAELSAPQLAVDQGSLVTTLEGRVELGLHLGPRASGPSEVTLLNASLLAADGQSVLLDRVNVNSDPGFPLTVPIDSDRGSMLRIDAADNLLDTDAKTRLCGDSDVVIQVVLDDALRGATLTATSAPFSLTGCS
jgi:hypothetical protein